MYSRRYGKAIPWVVFCLTLLLLLSCSQQIDPESFSARLKIKIQHQVDEVPLQRDTLAYQNRAGQHYEVSKLEYYISDFWLGNGDNGTGTKNCRYVRDSRNETLSWTLDSLAVGSYDTLRFFIGIPPDRNIEGGLPPTMDNINMTWPETMGGGYHFLRLEGRYRGDSIAHSGFALHLGKNEHLVRITIPGPFKLHQGTQKGVLTMDVNEWFQTPYTYDLNKDPNYTMSDSFAMNKIADNGKDAWNFRIITQ